MIWDLTFPLPSWAVNTKTLLSSWQAPCMFHQEGGCRLSAREWRSAPLANPHFWSFHSVLFVLVPSLCSVSHFRSAILVMHHLFPKRNNQNWPSMNTVWLFSMSLYWKFTQIVLIIWYHLPFQSRTAHHGTSVTYQIKCKNRSFLILRLTELQRRQWPDFFTIKLIGRGNPQLSHSICIIYA